MIGRIDLKLEHGILKVDVVAEPEALEEIKEAADKAQMDPERVQPMVALGHENRNMGDPVFVLTFRRRKD